LSDTDQREVFLGRQPILGREQQLFAYELLFRNGVLSTDNRADILDPTQATATVIANAFVELSISDSLGPYRGFINVDHDFLFSDPIEALPAERVALNILESIMPTSEAVARCQQLHDMGFTLAIDDIVEISEANRPLLALADIIRIDIMKMDVGRLHALVAELKPFGKKLLALKVESAELLTLCQSLGFDLFQGYYFAKPTIIVGKKLNPAQLSLVRLLALVMEDAETTAIESAFKLEPGLTVNMLRLTNSVSSGLRTKITSLRHAITILGRRQLQRWLQLLVYTNPQGSTQAINPLLQLAATRGRLMELLADRLQSRNREFTDQAFMVGIMSLMPALLGMAMEDILAQLPVAQRVKQALDDYGGQHGQLLQLVELTERSDLPALEEALGKLSGINADFLGNCLAQALSWANNLGHEKTPTAIGQ
jgi:c-di-GMP-related signal transduction protein